MRSELDRRSVSRRALPTGGALAASLVAHLLLLAGLSPATAPPRAPALQRGLSIELVEVPAATHPAAAPPAPPRRGARARREATTVARDRTPASSPDADAPPAAEPGPRPALDLVAEGVAAAPPERPAPDLRARLPLRPGDSPGVAAGAGRGATRAGPLQAWAAELAGRSRVESGLAPPYCGELGRALARGWDVEGVMNSRGVAGYVADLGGNLRSFGRVWSKMAEGYGRTGSPGVIDGGSARVRELAGLPPGPARDALVQAEVQRQLRRAWSEGHVTTVRVVQGADGVLRSVELTAPSRDAAVDREALAAVRRTVASLPAPPLEALAGRDALVTTWEFELEVSITPPVPVVAFEFDEVLGLADARLPLDRRIWKRVRLVAVD